MAKKKEEDFKTIKVNKGKDENTYNFPSLDLSKFEKQMKAFNSYSALDKFRNRTNVSPTFEFDTKGNLTSGKLLDLKNQGTSKFSIDYAGKISSNGLDVGSNKITSVTNPTANQDAATKNYVDTNEYTSSDFDTDFSGKSTTDLSEGTNLYFTTARIDTHLSGGNGITYSTGTISATNAYWESAITSGSQQLGSTSGVYETDTGTFDPGFTPTKIVVVGQIENNSSYGSGAVQIPFYETSSGQHYSQGIYDVSSGTFNFQYRWNQRDNQFENDSGNTFFEVTPDQGYWDVAGLRYSLNSGTEFAIRISLEVDDGDNLTWYYKYKVYCYKF